MNRWTELLTNLFMVLGMGMMLYFLYLQLFEKPLPTAHDKVCLSAECQKRAAASLEGYPHVQ